MISNRLGFVGALPTSIGKSARLASVDPTLHGGTQLSKPLQQQKHGRGAKRCVLRMARADDGAPKAQREGRLLQHASQLMDRGTAIFPFWVLGGALIGLFFPSMVVWFQGEIVLWTLSIIMLGMGLTLPLSELINALKSPRLVLFGAAAQFSIMPLLGFGISKLVRLPEPYMIGLVLVSTCPGGAASNLVCLLCGANLSLSVLMTTTTTLMSVLLTPALLKVLVQRVVAVNAAALMRSTVRMVLVPLVVGIVLQRKAPRLVRALSSFLPFFSVLGVMMICSSIVGLNSQALLSSGPMLLLAVFLLHSLGFLLGYLVSRWAGYEERNCRTISIEVGMQNSGLGAALAQVHFSNPLTAVPAALSATTHSLLGSFLAAFWQRLDMRRNAAEAEELAN